MTLDAHVTGIWCGQIRGGVGKFLELVTCLSKSCSETQRVHVSHNLNSLKGVIGDYIGDYCRAY